MSLKELAYKSKASQDGFEIYQMLKDVAEIRPKVIVEIGVDGGGFLETLQLVFPKARIIGIDIVERPELDKYEMLYGDSQEENTKQRLIGMLGNQQIDFLFIDGDHHYDAVKRDFELFSPLVRLNGIVGFHDTNNRGIEGVEVDRFMQEMDDKQSCRTADYRMHQMAPGTRLIWL